MTQRDDRSMLLLVDDEPANISLLERLFHNNHRLMSVSNGQSALDMLVQAPFDLVLLDIMMPIMNGLQTLEHIRANPRTADLPVILISALSQTQDVVRGLALGANDYVVKPIEAEVLMARVETQITLKRLQDEHKRTIAKLEAAQEMKDRFFRIASHDLKSPLANISMVQYLLREAVGDNPGALELVDMIDGFTATMDSVIHEFLDTAALQSGVLDLHMQTVFVAPVISKLLEQYRVHALKKSITLAVGDLDGIIHADEARISQALSNLVSNAIKYTKPSTRVSVYTEHDDDHVRISVADQGEGIPPGERDKLFTQFGKLSTRPTDGESSTGLGLWIVKHLVSLQGGRVGVDSRPEGGSIFWIDMPVAQTAVERA